MGTSVRIVKVALIRRPGYSVGRPAPMYLNCPCGANPAAPDDMESEVTCACGKRYTYHGYLIGESPTEG